MGTLLFCKGQGENAQLTGATVDLLKAISELENLEYDFTLVPWKRCLDGVENFARQKKYEGITEISYTEERSKLFFYSEPIYTTGEGFFYSKDKFPDGPKLKTTHDMNAHKVCGNSGFNYSMYHDAGLKKNIDMNTRSLKALFGKLVSGRCDFTIGSIEPIYGRVATGDVELFPQLVGEALPDIPRTKFHFAVSKQSPRGQDIINTLNRGIKTLKDTGQYENIFKKYLPTVGSGL